MRAVVLSLLLLGACSEERVIPPATPSPCGKPVCEAVCACDISTVCDPDCNGCDPECGECRPASIVCRAPNDGGPSTSGDGAVIAGDGGPRRDASIGGGCTRNDECPGQLCDRARGRCAECRTTADCSSNTRCVEGACASPSLCDSDLDCTPMGLVCDPGAGRCVECNSAAECQGSPCLGHSCVPATACTSSLDCVATRMVCGPALPPAWPASFLGQGCSECNAPVDCGPREACTDRLCTPVCAGRICGEIDGASCGACPGEERCLSSGVACVASIPLFGTQYFLDAGDRVFLGEDGRTGSGAIVEVVNGTSQPRLVDRAPASTYIDGLAMNGSRIYWALTNGEIKTRDRTGGAVTVFTRVPGTPGDSWCQAIAADDQYVVCALTDYGNSRNSGFYRFPVGGGEGLKLDPATQPDGLFMEGGSAYMALFNDSRVIKVDVVNPNRTLLAREQGRLHAVIGGAAYFTNTNDELRRVPAGTTTPQTIATNFTWAGHSATELYLVNPSRDLLMRTGLDGSAPTVIARLDELGLGDSIVRAFRRADGLYVQGESGTVRLSP